MKSRLETYLCLCVPNFYAQTRLRFHQELSNKPFAIIDKDSPVKMIVDLNEAARTLGLSVGMSSVQASLASGLLVYPRSATEEETTRNDLLHTCLQVTPLVEDCSVENQCILVLSIAASLNIFGGTKTLTTELLSAVAALKLQAKAASSHNFHTAVMLSTSRTCNLPVHVPCGEEMNSLAQLPVNSLPLDIYQQETFANWGVCLLRDIAALPLNELVSRMGQPAKRLHQMATGTCAHIFQPLQTTSIYKEQVGFDSPVDLFESLLFSIAPMLDRLILRAREEMKSITALTVSMVLSDRSSHIRTIQPALASTDNKLFLKLLHLDMDAHPPKAGVLELTLTAILGLSQRIQLGIFSPQHPDASHLQVTLARIRKVVGPDNAGSPVLEDSHRQSTFALRTFTTIDPYLGNHTTGCSYLAKRQLKSPTPIDVSVLDHLPSLFFLAGCRFHIQKAYGPWKSTGKWWNSQPWDIEQWDVIATDVASRKLFRCCLSMDKRTGWWCLDGIYD